MVEAPGVEAVALRCGLLVRDGGFVKPSEDTVRVSRELWCRIVEALEEAADGNSCIADVLALARKVD